MPLALPFPSSPHPKREEKRLLNYQEPLFDRLFKELSTRGVSKEELF
jgi:hypothetical protein